MRLAELKDREIINIGNGHRLGYLYDVDMDLQTGQICTLIVPGPCRYFGLFGREDDYILPFDCIVRVGADMVLVDVKPPYKRCKRWRRGFLS